MFVRAQEKSRLDIVSEFHLGDFVNRIVPGSLVMTPSEVHDDVTTAAGGPAAPVSIRSLCQNKLLFATITGAVGAVFTIQKSLFLFLARLQVAMRQYVIFLLHFPLLVLSFDVHCLARVCPFLCTLVCFHVSRDMCHEFICWHVNSNDRLHVHFDMVCCLRVWPSLTRSIVPVCRVCMAVQVCVCD
jgi:hypothetical protein